MIKTKEAQIVDAQKGIKAIVFFWVSHSTNVRVQNQINFNIVSGIEQVNENGQAVIKPINETNAVFKTETFNKLFGEMTSNEFETALDSTLIDQIDYINNWSYYNEDGSIDTTKEVNKFWSLTAEDLEIIQ